MTEPYTVPGTDTIIVGEELARLPQGRPESKPRWSETAVFQLENDRFAVIKTSFSNVYHQDNTACRIKSFESAELTEQDIAGGAQPCPTCKPSRQVGERVMFENDISEVSVLETPEGVAKALLWKRNGEVLLTPRAQAILDILGDKDSRFRLIQTVIK